MVRVLLLLAAVATPIAQNPDLQHALKAYDDLDYDTAGHLFDQVLSGGDLSPSDQKLAEFYGGIVFFDLNQLDKAHDAFTKALQLDPTLTLDSDAAPKLQDYFAGVKKEVAAAAPKPSDVPSAAAQTEQKPALTPAPKPAEASSDLDESEATGSTPIYHKPWFWVGVGAVAAAAVVVVVVLATHHSGSCVSSGSNGCIDVQVQQQQGLVQW